MMPTSEVVLTSPGGLLGTETMQGQEKIYLITTCLGYRYSAFTVGYFFLRRKEEMKKRKDSEKKTSFQGYCKIKSLNGLTK